MPVTRIKNALSKSINQRIVYGLGLALWTYLMWGRLSTSAYSTSSFGVTYITLYIIPAVILFIQMIRNNQLLWVVIFGLVTLNIAAGLFMTMADAIERRDHHVKAIDWKFTDIVLLATILAGMFAVEWVIYHIRPKRLI